MNAAKIQLSSGHNEFEEAGAGPNYHNIKSEWMVSPEEMGLVTNEALIRTKNAIIGKAVALLAALSEKMREESAGPLGSPTASQGTGLLAELLCTAPKISKGEHYKGLPWVVLDYPRSFGRADVFAIRTLFWWGKYFSLTLHLKGVYKSAFLPSIRRHIPGLAGAGFRVGISEDEWRHELEGDNYLPLDELAPGELDAILVKHPFLKFSAKCGLENWNEAEDILFRLYATVIQSLI